MQLLAIILYSRWGDRRILRFAPGRLNVVTGQSKTGKSALLDIVEFCLGRTTVPMAVGPITTTVAWYAVLVQLPAGGRAFIGRPAAGGSASTQQGMLEFGSDLEPLEANRLLVNADAGSIRSRLGSLIGIEENVRLPEAGSLGAPLEANLGHALFLCLQGQSEIANRTLLFHRQGDEGVASSIRGTLPYFLGAVPPEQALKRQLLDATRRDLRRTVAELQAAEAAAERLDVAIRAAVAEAYTAGLVNQSVYPDRSSALRALTTAVNAPVAEPVTDDVTQDRIRELNEQRTELRRQLREATELRNMLVADARDEGLYEGALTNQMSRLTSIDLLPPASSEAPSDECPVCGSHLSVADPTTVELQNAVREVRSQLADLAAARPRLRGALADLDQRIADIRDQLRALDQTVAELSASIAPRLPSESERLAFSRGRLEALLQSMRAIDVSRLSLLRDRVAGLRASVERLEAELDADEEREQVTSRLLTISGDMTTWANRLELEHAGGAVRLDPGRLTVVADTESGAVPMSRIGSAENWIGYHLVTHLALHRFFVRHDRPVPHFLMLDQPTQAYYPSEIEQVSGVPSRDEDRVAVRRLYDLMQAVVQDLSPSLQVIVCDHANLDEPWFQASIVENWRDGGQLIPESWIDRSHA